MMRLALVFSRYRTQLRETGAPVQFRGPGGKDTLGAFLKCAPWEEETEASCGQSVRPPPADEQSPEGPAGLRHPVWEGKEHSRLRLLSAAAQGVGGNIESKRSASPNHQRGS